jgi:hypothetical protein
VLQLVSMMAQQRCIYVYALLAGNLCHSACCCLPCLCCSVLHASLLPDWKPGARAAALQPGQQCVATALHAAAAAAGVQCGSPLLPYSLQPCACLVLCMLLLLLLAS